MGTIKREASQKGRKDADGFYWGECGGISGFVPCNMVSEVQVDDDRFLQDITKVSEQPLLRSFY